MEFLWMNKTEWLVVLIIASLCALMFVSGFPR